MSTSSLSDELEVLQMIFERVANSETTHTSSWNECYTDEHCVKCKYYNYSKLFNRAVCTVEEKPEEDDGNEWCAYYKEE